MRYDKARNLDVRARLDEDPQGKINAEITVIVENVGSVVTVDEDPRNPVAHSSL